MKLEHIAGMVFLVVGIAAHQIGRARLEQRSPGVMGAAKTEIRSIGERMGQKLTLEPAMR